MSNFSLNDFFLSSGELLTYSFSSAATLSFGMDTNVTKDTNDTKVIGDTNDRSDANVRSNTNDHTKVKSDNNDRNDTGLQVTQMI